MLEAVYHQASLYEAIQKGASMTLNDPIFRAAWDAILAESQWDYDTNGYMNELMFDDGSVIKINQYASISLVCISSETMNYEGKDVCKYDCHGVNCKDCVVSHHTEDIERTFEKMKVR